MARDTVGTSQYSQSLTPPTRIFFFVACLPLLMGKRQTYPRRKILSCHHHQSNNIDIRTYVHNSYLIRSLYSNIQHHEDHWFPSCFRWQRLGVCPQHRFERANIGPEHGRLGQWGHVVRSRLSGMALQVWWRQVHVRITRIDFQGPRRVPADHQGGLSQHPGEPSGVRELFGFQTHDDGTPGRLWIVGGKRIRPGSRLFGQNQGHWWCITSGNADHHQWIHLKNRWWMLF